MKLPVEINPMAYPEYANACEKLEELKSGLRERQQRLDALSAEINADAIVRLSQRTKKAIALLSGKTLSSADLESMNQSAALLRSEIGVYYEAIRLQEVEVANALRQVSDMINKALRPMHTEIVKRLAKALVDAAKANAEEIKLREALRDHGILQILRPMAYNKVGVLETEESHVNHYLREAREFGYVGPAVQR